MSTLNVYVSQYSHLKGADLHAETQESLAQGLIVTTANFTAEQGYTLVGSAEVNITLFPRAEMVARQVDALRKEIEDTRMQAGVRCLQLERQINSLLCIEGAASEVSA